LIFATVSSRDSIPRVELSTSSIAASPVTFCMIVGPVSGIAWRSLLFVSPSVEPLAMARIRFNSGESRRTLLSSGVSRATAPASA